MIRKTTFYLVIVSGSIIMVLPLVWMLSTSLKLPPDIMSYPPKFIPNPITWGNYSKAWEEVSFGRCYLNISIVTAIAVISTLFLSSLAGFAFGKYKFPGRNILFLLVLSTLMIPFQITMLPLYLEMVKFNWVDTLWALVVPNVASAFGTFLIRQYVQTIPDELLDIARIDGCSEFRIFWNIILPLCKPALTVIALFTFIWSWSDFLWPLIVINSPSNNTLTIGITGFYKSIYVDWGPLMAASSIIIIPTIVVFIFSQKHLIKGIALTGLKF